MLTYRYKSTIKTTKIFYEKSSQFFYREINHVETLEQNNNSTNLTQPFFLTKLTSVRNLMLEYYMRDIHQSWRIYSTSSQLRNIRAEYKTT